MSTMKTVYCTYGQKCEAGRCNSLVADGLHLYTTARIFTTRRSYLVLKLSHKEERIVIFIRTTTLQQRKGTRQSIGFV